MIAFRKDEDPNKNTEKGLQKLLDILVVMWSTIMARSLRIQTLQS